MHFCYAEAYKCHFMIGRKQWWDGYYSTLLAGETKTVVLVEAILGEEKSYPKPVQLEANFQMLSISSSFALKVWKFALNLAT